MSKMKIRPLGDQVWIEPFAREETTASGIILPETAKEKPQEGKVLAVGPGTRDEAGKRQPLDVEQGNRVLFAKYAGTEFKQNGTTYLIMRESDILAVLSEEEWLNN
jgi:chaperonin GroES